jgi:hypothetical protein
MNTSIGRQFRELFDTRGDRNIRRHLEEVYRGRRFRQKPACEKIHEQNYSHNRAWSKKSRIVLTILFFSLSATNITSAIPRASMIAHLANA